jgi:peptide deformylase
MAQLKILQYPDPVLKQKSLEVNSFNEEVDSFINDLIDTLRASPGVGLAASQLGVLKRIIAVDVSPGSPGHGLLVIVNPEIVSTKGMKFVREGCLSVPEYTANIRRAEEVKVSGLDREGKEVMIESAGLEAVCLQHEIDHLEGILFIDRIESVKSLFRRKVIKQV